MTTLLLSEEDVAQAIADYVKKIAGESLASKISSATLEFDKEGEYLYSDCVLRPIKVTFNMKKGV